VTDAARAGNREQGLAHQAERAPMLPARRAMRAAALPSPAREVAPTNSGRTGPGLRVPWGPVALEDPVLRVAALPWS